MYNVFIHQIISFDRLLHFSHCFYCLKKFVHLKYIFFQQNNSLKIKSTKFLPEYDFGVISDKNVTPIHNSINSRNYLINKIWCITNLTWICIQQKLYQYIWECIEIDSSIVIILVLIFNRNLCISWTCSEIWSLSYADVMTNTKSSEIQGYYFMQLIDILTYRLFRFSNLDGHQKLTVLAAVNWWILIVVVTTIESTLRLSIFSVL